MNLAYQRLCDAMRGLRVNGDDEQDTHVHVTHRYASLCAKVLVESESVESLWPWHPNCLEHP